MISAFRPGLAMKLRRSCAVCPSRMMASNTASTRNSVMRQRKTCGRVSFVLYCLGAILCRCSIEGLRAKD